MLAACEDEIPADIAIFSAAVADWRGANQAGNKLKKDGKGSLRLLLNDTLTVSLGSDDSGRKIDQLLAVYEQQIKGREREIRYIDFRYSNGFAVRWQQTDTQARTTG